MEAERYLEVRLSTNTARELLLFCKAHYEADRNSVVEAALRSYLETQLRTHRTLQRAFRRRRTSLTIAPGGSE